MFKPLRDLRHNLLLIVKWAIYQIIKKQGFELTGMDYFNQISAGGIVVSNHEGHMEGVSPLVMLNVNIKLWTKTSAVKNRLARFVGRNMFHYVDEEDPLELIESSKRNIKNRCIYFIAPEGTRNFGIGLRRGQPGIARLLSSFPDAKIAPMATYYTSRMNSSPFDLLRSHPDFKARFGPTFRIKKRAKFSLREIQELADEIMLRIGEGLPKSRLGYYKNHIGRPYKYTETVELPERAKKAVGS